MIDVEKLFDLNIGLVLAGGGAKGAYEAGVFKALWELDIIRRVSVVSGTSIGTINGLMLSMNDGNVMDKSWSNISYSRFINNENKIRDINIKKLIKREDTVDKEKKLADLFKKNDIGFSTAMVENSLAKTARFQTGELLEDFLYWLDLLKNGQEALSLAEPLAFYRSVPSSRSSNKIKMAAARWRVLRQRERRLRTLSESDEKHCFVPLLNNTERSGLSYTSGSSSLILTSFLQKNGQADGSDSDEVLFSEAEPYQTSISLEIRDLLPFPSLAYRCTS